MMIFPSAEPHYNTGVTVELREIVENGVDLWAFDYPSFYEGDYKTAFERKVVDHYYFRQIGQETVGRFLHCFRSKVREIMPYYVDLYKTVLLYNDVKDPFENVDMVEELTQTRQTTGTTSSSSERSATSTGTTSSSSERSATSTGTSSNEFESEKIGSENVETENTRKFSNTPQGEIADLDHYMTEATVDNGKQDTGNNETVTQRTSGTSSATDTATQSDEASAESTNSENLTNNGSSEGSETLTNRFTRKGNHGVDTFAKVLKEHRSAIINIDMMIIEELGDLFLKVY